MVWKKANLEIVKSLIFQKSVASVLSCIFSLFTHTPYSHRIHCVSTQKPLLCFSDSFYEFYEFCEGLHQFFKFCEVLNKFSFLFWHLFNHNKNIYEQDIISDISKPFKSTMRHNLSTWEDTWIGKPFPAQLMIFKPQKISWNWTT